MSIKNSSDTIGNRTHDLPVSSAVPQPTAPQRGPRLFLTKHYSFNVKKLVKPLQKCIHGSLAIRGAHFGNQRITKFRKKTFTTFCGLLNVATVVFQLLKSDVIFNFMSIGYTTKGPLTLQSTALCERVQLCIFHTVLTRSV